MDTWIGGDIPPESSDLEGWRKAIEDDLLKTFRLEAIAAAFQDLGQRDKRVQNSLAEYLSRSIIRIVRQRVGSNHPNQGKDIILRVHDEIFISLLRPKSADGRNLREAFVPRLLFRMKDAIAAEEREGRIPDEARRKKRSETKKLGDAVNEQEVQIGAFLDGDDSVKEPETTEDQESVQRKIGQTWSFDGVRATNEQIDVARVLGRVSDPRKRLAFYLFMNEVPFHSKRKDVTSIARAIGISDKTARAWVEEVRQILEADKDVKYLKERKVGDRT